MISFNSIKNRISNAVSGIKKVDNHYDNASQEDKEQFIEAFRKEVLERYRYDKEENSNFKDIAFAGSTLVTAAGIASLPLTGGASMPAFIGLVGGGALAGSGLFKTVAELFKGSETARIRLKASRTSTTDVITKNELGKNDWSDYSNKPHVNFKKQFGLSMSETKEIMEKCAGILSADAEMVPPKVSSNYNRDNSLGQSLRENLFGGLSNSMSDVSDNTHGRDKNLGMS